MSLQIEHHGGVLRDLQRAAEIEVLREKDVCAPSPAPVRNPLVQRGSAVRVHPGEPAGVFVQDGEAVAVLADGTGHIRPRAAVVDVLDHILAVVEEGAAHCFDAGRQVQGGQAAAVCKRPVLDLGDPIGNGNPGQGAAPLKRIRSDHTGALGNLKRAQSAAICKPALFDVTDRSLDDDLGQPVAVGKGLLADGVHATLKRDAFQVVADSNRAVPECADIAGEGEAGQGVTELKHPHFDGPHIAFDGETGQLFAEPERGFANRAHAALDGKPLQRPAVFKGVFANRADILKGDAGQCIAILESRLADDAHVAANPDAGQGPA